MLKLLKQVKNRKRVQSTENRVQSTENRGQSTEYRKKKLKNLLTTCGFLLFEVMVAVAVLSIGLTLILRSFATSIDAVRVSQDHTRALLLLERKLFELERAGSVTSGTTTGKFEGDLQRFNWELESTELEEAPLNQVTLSVKWQTSRRPQKMSVVTYLGSEEEEEE